MLAMIAGSSTVHADVSVESHADRGAGTGFGAHVGLGVGRAWAIQSHNSGTWMAAFAGGPTVAVGYSFHRKHTALLRASAQFFELDRAGERLYWEAQLGAGYEYWPKENLALSATVGLGLLATDPVETFLSRGLSAGLRASYAPWRGDALDLVFGYELQATVYLNYEVTPNFLVISELRF